MPDFDAVSLQQRPKLRKLDDYSPQLFEPLTFFDMTPRFRDGSDTPRAYLERCLAVIADREPVVKAWVLLNPSGAREVADASTERYRRGLPFSPIDGMPIGIEDLIETKDMPTGHGCAAFARNHTRRDSAIVQALRDAGAVVLGIDCDDRDGRRVSGPDHQSVRPRADAGRLVERFSRGDRRLHGTAAIGTQVGGSLIRPASYCGNCALKPTMGALHRGERQGYSQSHVGVHAGSLTDMWRVAMEIARRAGGDPGQPGLFGAPDLSPALQPARLIVMETAGWAELDAKTQEGFDRILAALPDAGVEVLRATDDPLIEAFEHGIAEAKAITTDICDWENRWSFENLVEQYPGTVTHFTRGSRPAVSCRLTIIAYACCSARRRKTDSPQSPHWPTR